MRKFGILLVATMMTSSVAVMLLFGQASPANVGRGADLYGGTSALYLPLHELEPIF
jgi:hypothetical protein